MGRIATLFPRLSVRRQCRWLHWRRSGVYARRLVKAEAVRRQADALAVAAMRKTRQEYLCWGFRLIWTYLRTQGVRIARHRAYRLYRSAGLSLYRSPKKPRLKRVYQELLPPAQINQGWAMDFVSEWIIGPQQQSVRLINVVDECSRKDLWVEAAHSITAAKLSETLEHIIQMRGQPAYIRCDNGPEFISEHLNAWARNKNIELRFIQPGKPTQNGIIERLNGTLRKECLNLHWFHSLDDLNERLGHWFKTYNFDRPHSSLDYLTPHDFEIQNQNLYLKVVAA